MKIKGFFTISILISLVALYSCDITKKKVELIKVNGNSFVLESGDSVIFRGLAMADPYKLDTMNAWKPEYFKEAKNWGANLVRVPVLPIMWRKAGKETYVKYLDEAVKWAEQSGLYVIIDWHSMGNLNTEIFQDSIYDTSMEETYEFWRLISKRFNGNNTVAFYEIFNEPTTWFGKFGEMSWDRWRDIAKSIVDTIRLYDTETIPLIAGLDWGYDLTQVGEKPFDIENIAYAIHPYPQKSKEPWEENWEKTWGYVADSYPMIAAEFGYAYEDEEGSHFPTYVTSNDFAERIVTYFSKKGMSWTIWCFAWDWYPVLLQDSNYTPSPTQGTFFKKVLQENITSFPKS